MTRTRTNKGLREEAKLAMWNYYSEHRAWMPKWIREHRQEILTEIQSGRDVEIVFNTIIERVEEELAGLSAA